MQRAKHCSLRSPELPERSASARRRASVESSDTRQAPVRGTPKLRHACPAASSTDPEVRDHTPRRRGLHARGHAHGSRRPTAGRSGQCNERPGRKPCRDTRAPRRSGEGRPEQSLASAIRTVARTRRGTPWRPQSSKSLPAERGRTPHARFSAHEKVPRNEQRTNGSGTRGSSSSTDRASSSPRIDPNRIPRTSRLSAVRTASVRSKSPVGGT